MEPCGYVLVDWNELVEHVLSGGRLWHIPGVRVSLLGEEGVQLELLFGKDEVLGEGTGVWGETEDAVDCWRGLVIHFNY